MESSVHIVSRHVLDSPPVAFAVRHWDALRGMRRYPTRDELLPRDIAGILRHIVLIRILDSGADFEYRIVGDAHVQAHGSNFIGMRLKQIEEDNPGFDPNTRATYEFVRFTGEPLRSAAGSGGTPRNPSFATMKPSSCPREQPRVSITCLL